MKEASQTCDLPTCTDSNGCICSLELAGGNTPSGLLDGQMSLFGPDHAPANHSARRASARANKTAATSGPKCSGSSASAALQRSLVSKLAERLGSVGSTEFSQTWKEKVTPAGRRYWTHTASARRMSGNGCFGWLTPTTTRREAEAQLGVMPGIWPTPKQRDRGRQGRRSKPHTTGGNANLDEQAWEWLSGWATPAARDWKSGDASEATMNRNARPLNEQATLMVGFPSGATPSSHHASTAKRAVLNPRFSLWLMGYPEEWASCGERAMQSCLKQLRRSSKRS